MNMLLPFLFAFFPLQRSFFEFACHLIFTGDSLFIPKFRIRSWVYSFGGSFAYLFEFSYLLLGDGQIDTGFVFLNAFSIDLYFTS